MQLDITFSYTESYLPSKRHRKLRQRAMVATQKFELHSLDSNKFPTAFVTHEFKRNTVDSTSFYLSELLKTYKTFDNRLFRLLNICGGFAQINEFMQMRVDEFNRRAVKKQHNGISKEIISANIQSYLNTYIIVDEKEIWYETVEPIYFVELDYSGYMHPIYHVTIQDSADNLPLPYSFNALQKEEAEKCCEQRAQLSYAYMGPSAYIEVLMPEMVKCDPQAEYIVSLLSN